MVDPLRFTAETRDLGQACDLFVRVLMTILVQIVSPS